MGLHNYESTVAICIDKVQVLLLTLPVLYIEMAERKNHADTSHHRTINEDSSLWRSRSLHYEI